MFHYSHLRHPPLFWLFGTSSTVNGTSTSGRFFCFEGHALNTGFSNCSFGLDHPPDWPCCCCWLGGFSWSWLFIRWEGLGQAEKTGLTTSWFGSWAGPKGWEKAGLFEKPVLHPPLGGFWGLYFWGLLGCWLPQNPELEKDCWCCWGCW